MEHLKLFEEFSEKEDKLDNIIMHFYQSQENKQYFFPQNSNINTHLWEKEKIGDYFEIKNNSLWYYTPGNKNPNLGMIGSYEPIEILYSFNRRFKTDLKNIVIFDSINKKIIK